MVTLLNETALPLALIGALSMFLDDGRGGVSSSNGRAELPRQLRPNSPTQSHSHSHALSREVLSDQQSVPIAESWCVTKVI